MFKIIFSHFYNTCKFSSWIKCSNQNARYLNIIIEYGSCLHQRLIICVMGALSYPHGLMPHFVWHSVDSSQIINQSCEGKWHFCWLIVFNFMFKFMYLEVQVSYLRRDYTKPNLNGDRDFSRHNLFSPYSHDNGGHLNFSLNTRILVNLRKSLS